MCKKLIYLISFVLVLVAVPLVTHAQVENLAINPSFEEDEVILDDQDYEQWWTWGVQPDLTSTVEIDETEFVDGARSLRVNSIGGTDWFFIVANSPMPVEVGTNYTASFWAKAEEARPLAALFKATDNSINWGYTDFELTTEWAEYTMTSEAINAELKLEIFCAGSKVPFWLDFVYVYEGKYVAGIEPEEASPPEKATAPVPADGAYLEETWGNFSWTPGSHAVSHDVYLGENYDDVNDGAPDSSGFRGNQAATFFIASFPGFPYPDGLVPGTTYYWRVDEVEADGTTKHKGDVWSFMILPKTAYDPNPADDTKFIDPNTAFSWSSGLGSKLHTVYFGENFDDVNNAAGGLPQGATTYTPGTLELVKTYYWRVDEFDAVNTYKGDIWSFTTAGAGGGVRANYYKGMNFESHVLTRIDPQIDFSWGSGGPDPAVGEDQFSVRWTGEVEAAFTETYTFYTNSDEGIRLWVDGQQLVDNWTSHSNALNRGKIDLVAGNTYGFVMEHYEDTGGAVAHLRWESASTPQQLIPQAALSLPVKASRSKPPNRAVDVKQTQILTWSPGEVAASHQVYFGTDEDAVKYADTGSPEYKGTGDLGAESYDPGILEWDTAYYWRIDEVNNVNPDSPWTGSLWSFTTANFLIVDDFESYNDLNPDEPGSNRIFYAWLDGLDDPTNGSVVGYDNPPFTEQTIVHGGNQSMPLYYDNSVGYSEATLTLTYPRDWTENGVNKLPIWFRGNSDNAAETLYVALNGSAVVNQDNPNAAQIGNWTAWNIDLQVFADQGVDLTNVNTIALGLGDRNNPQPGGKGLMFFDDIRLYRP